NIPPDHSGSSFFADASGATKINGITQALIRRFDEVCPPISGPALMKIDTQGAELMILAGIGKRLSEIDFFIIETSLLQIYVNAADFSDVMGFMMKHDFCFFDLISLHRRPYDRTLADIDAVFVPRNSRLRSELRWE